MMSFIWFVGLDLHTLTASWRGVLPVSEMMKLGSAFYLRSSLTYSTLAFSTANTSRVLLLAGFLTYFNTHTYKLRSVIEDDLQTLLTLLLQLAVYGIEGHGRPVGVFHFKVDFGLLSQQLDNLSTAIHTGLHQVRHLF
jgi:hypothetical protein